MTDSWKKLGMDLAQNCSRDFPRRGLFIVSPEMEMQLCKRARILRRAATKAEKRKS